MQKNLQVIYKALLFISVLAALWIFFAFLLPFVLPFICALVLAKLMDRSICALQRRLHIPRAVSAAILTVFTVTFLVGLLFLLGTLIFSQINSLLEKLPDLASRLPELSTAWKTKMEIWIEATPPSLQNFLRDSINQILNESVTIPTALYRTLGGWVSSTASALPGFLLFLVALVLSTYFIASDYPRITKLLLRPFSPQIREKILQTKNLAMETVGKWLKSQGIMLMITFSELLIGMFLLKVDYALVLAGAAAIFDALPVIGVGLFLVPWAVFNIATGNTLRGILILALYSVISLVRSFVEPKIVGSQIGQPPLLTLIAMYIGFRAFSIAGMILFPILSAIILQMTKWGWFKKKETAENESPKEKPSAP